MIEITGLNDRASRRYSYHDRDQERRSEESDDQTENKTTKEIDGRAENKDILRESRGSVHEHSNI